MMAGTGFFDSWQPVDTNNPSAAPAEKKVIVTEDWPKGDKSEGFDSMEDHPMVTQFNEATGQSEANVSPPPAGIVTLSNNPAWLAIANARIQASMPTVKNYVFMGVSGHPKSGKTGIALDSLTDDETNGGAEIIHLDFDMGGESTRAAHHHGKTNILTINPWILHKNPSRVPYDFPATYQNVMDLLLAAQEQSQIQNAYFAEHGTMPRPYLKTVVFDGAGHWLNICETMMKVEDLQLGDDGIAVSGKKATVQIGRFNWNIRKNRYNSAMTALTELCRSGIHCYLITHLKDSYDSSGNEIAGAEVPTWLKGTEKWLQQRTVMETVQERNERGELTGAVKSYGVLIENRTSLKTQGKVLVFERNTDGGIWHGWKGLRDGSFEHPDDVIGE